MLAHRFGERLNAAFRRRFFSPSRIAGESASERATASALSASASRVMLLICEEIRWTTTSTENKTALTIRMTVVPSFMGRLRNARHGRECFIVDLSGRIVRLLSLMRRLIQRHRRCCSSVEKPVLPCRGRYLLMSTGKRHVVN